MARLGRRALPVTSVGCRRSARPSCPRSGPSRPDWWCWADLVLGELVDDRVQQVLDPQTLLPSLQHRLDRVFLGAVDDVLDHGAGVEVLEVHDFLVTVGVGDLQEPLSSISAYIRSTTFSIIDLTVSARRHRTRPGRRRARQILGQVLAEDVLRASASGRSILIFTSRRRAAGWPVDHVLTVGGADHDDVLQPLDAVDLAQQLGHHGGLDVRADAGAAGPEDLVHLVEEHDHGCPRRPSRGPAGRSADVPLGLATNLFSSSGPLMLRK